MVEVRSCGVLIYRTDPKRSFLLMRHADRWDLPKGHLDPGESDLECALRELDEETGIKQDHIEIDPEFRFINHYTVNYKRQGNTPKLKELVIFLGRLVRPVEIAVTEHQGYEWFDWEPPHEIQSFTIDPLLKHLEQHWLAK